MRLENPIKAASCKPRNSWSKKSNIEGFPEFLCFLKIVSNSPQILNTRFTKWKHTELRNLRISTPTPPQLREDLRHGTGVRTPKSFGAWKIPRLTSTKAHHQHLFSPVKWREMCVALKVSDLRYFGGMKEKPRTLPGSMCLYFKSTFHQFVPFCFDADTCWQTTRKSLKRPKWCQKKTPTSKLKTVWVNAQLQAEEN